MARLQWKKQKTLAMLANRRQWNQEFDPTQTSVTEFTTENGVFLGTETLSNPNNNIYNYYIIAE